jgi:hypothetical protein
MAATPDRLPGADVEGGSRLRLTELDRDWALRRLELFESLDGSVQQAMGTVLEVTTRVLRTADELRHEMEQQATDLVAQLRSEREVILQEIEAHRRQRDGLTAEMFELRRGVEAEVALTRRQAEEDAARLRQQAEAEIARRQSQADEETAARQRRAEAEIAAARQQAEAEIAALQQQAETEREGVLAEAQARRLALVGEIRDLEEQLGAVASQLQAMVDRRGPASARPASEGPPTPRPAQGAPGTRYPAGPPSTGPVGRKAAARLAAGVAPRQSAPAEGASTAPAAPADTAGPNGDAPTAEASAAGPAAATAVVTTLATESRVTVRRITAFSSALELQRAMQSCPGIRDVQALQFEDGTLVLAVEHDADLDLAETIARLPIQTELRARSSGGLELTVSPA